MADALIVHEFIRSDPTRRPGYFRCGITTGDVPAGVEIHGSILPERTTCPACLAARE